MICYAKPYIDELAAHIAARDVEFCKQYLDNSFSDDDDNANAGDTKMAFIARLFTAFDLLDDANKVKFYNTLDEMVTLCIKYH
jgi:hypothetical protein